MIKMLNVIGRCWSWCKGFMACILLFVAAATVFIMIDDDLSIHNKKTLDHPEDTKIIL